MKNFKDRYVLGVGYPGFTTEYVDCVYLFKSNDPNNTKIVRLKEENEFNRNLLFSPKYRLVLERVKGRKAR